MSILALPSDATRMLGSAQVLTTPTSLVKELIDNALDAKATSIEVSIAANTIDKIEVRDNGHGIVCEDLDALGRPGHTSKLRNFGELHNIGGTSLGFRGEALASAIALGDISVTTKTEGELVATIVRLKATGGIGSQAPTSHPVGTTVCVTNFLFKIPVRKQTAVKSASKTIQNIKEMLQGYALARLTVKFSLKVLRTGKENWSFSPRPSDTVKDIVSQVLGRDIASQCIGMSNETAVVFDISPNPTSPLQPLISSDVQARPRQKFLILAFLPRPDADVTKISAGQYVSIDSRPVSCSRGAVKKIITIFKSYVRACIVQSPQKKIKNPFLRLDIVCPVGSYDANIEPAKDDLLFVNECDLLSSVEDLFKSVYGNLPSVDKCSKETVSVEESGLELLLAQKPKKNSHTVPNYETPRFSGNTNFTGSVFRENGSNITKNCMGMNSPSTQISESSFLRANHRKGGVGMSENFSEVQARERSHPQRYSGQIGPRTAIIEGGDTGMRLPNPWIIGKLNATTPETVPTHVPEQNRQDGDDILQQFSPTLQHDTNLQIHQTGIVPKSPKTLQSPTSSRSLSAASSNLHLTVPDREESEVQNSLEEWIDDLPLGISFDLPRYSSVGSTAGQENEDDDIFIPDTSDHRNNSDQNPTFSNVREMQPFQALAKHSSGLYNPFACPVRRNLTLTNQNGTESSTLGNCQETKAGYSKDSGSRVFVEPMLTTHARISDAMDYERRKDKATKRLREEIKALGSGLQTPPGTQNGISVRNSPHNNRYNAAVGTLDSFLDISNTSKVSVDWQPAKTSLPVGDPRAYLIRHQNSLDTHLQGNVAALKLKRAKSMFLPFENVPAKSKIQNLVFLAEFDHSLTFSRSAVLSQYDEYIKSGNFARGLDMPASQIPNVRRRLEITFRNWAETKRVEGQALEVEMNLQELEGNNERDA